MNVVSVGGGAEEVFGRGKESISMTVVDAEEALIGGAVTEAALIGGAVTGAALIGAVTTGGDQRT